MTRAGWLLINAILLSGMLGALWFALNAPELSRLQYHSREVVKLPDERPPLPPAAYGRSGADAVTALARRPLFSAQAAADAQGQAEMPMPDTDGPIARTLLGAPIETPQIDDVEDLAALHRDRALRALIFIEELKLRQFLHARALPPGSRTPAPPPPQQENAAPIEAQEPIAQTPQDAQDAPSISAEAEPAPSVGQEPEPDASQEDVSQENAPEVELSEAEIAQAQNGAQKQSPPPRFKPPSEDAPTEEPQTTEQAGFVAERPGLRPDFPTTPSGEEVEPPEDFILLATYLGRGDGHALVRTPSGNLRVEQGGRLDGWLFEEIGSDFVRITREGKISRLELPR